MKETLIELFTRDLLRLKEEISLYRHESNLWKTEKSINNSGGNLCLHIIGNLKTYIGNNLAYTGYVRRREFEFSAKNISCTDLCNELDETIEVVIQGIKSLSEGQMEDSYPKIIWKEKKGMAYTLIHLHSHLNYHLGQINYHRRILDHK